MASKDPESPEEISRPPVEPAQAESPGGFLSRFAARPAPTGAATARGAEPKPAEGGGEGSAGGEGGSFRRVQVADGDVQRPFMRGILVHSLTERGVSFEDAYEVAQKVWERVRTRPQVPLEELRALVHELSAEVGRPSIDPDDVEALLPVHGKDGRWPFNQARLQQSLLAAGLRPLEAFEATLAIERALRDRGDDSVTRDEIRDLAARTLSERFGAEVAHRYLAWRSFQAEDERPVVLLLGGTTGVGKSSLALEVARRLSIGRVLSTDSVRDVMRVMLTEDLMPTLHVSSFEAHKRLGAALREGANPVIEGFLEQSRTVMVGVRAVIERAIAEGTSTVIDGVSLVPGLFDARAWAGRAHVFFLVAADEDRESLYSHLVARAHGKGARASERYVRNFREIFTIQEDLLERAREQSVPVVDVQDLEVAARRVVQHVVSELGARRAAEAEDVA